MPDVHRDLVVLALAGGRHPDAGGAVFDQFKVLPGDGNQVHVPVQSAIEREIRELGVHPVIFAVVGDDGQEVFSIRQRAGQIHPEGGITAVVAGQMGTVQVDVRAAVAAPDFKEVCLIGLFGNLQLPRIGRSAPPVVSAAVLTVDVVPGMRQVDGLTILGPVFRDPVCLFKYPALVQIGNCSHNSSCISQSCFVGHHFNIQK